MFQDEHRNRIVLGERIGAPGGEGTTYAVVGRGDLAAKIYHSHRVPDDRHCAKLKQQVQAPLPAVRRVAAWPQKLVLSDGKVVGFLMPKIPGKSIHLLYRPDDRTQHFPKATWQSLVDVGRNVAAAFHCLHQNDVIMGDVNESNVLVSEETGEVRFIDCDSFQIRASNGQVFPCSVFTAGWIPPELIESPIISSQRTIQHDLFGLAVLIFHLLFMGRHPFAAVPPDHLLENAPSLEELIKKRIFPYSEAARGSFKPPPNFLTLQDLPNNLANLFERAFITYSRPTAEEWCRVLEGIELKKCRWGHVFYRRVTDCPWCSIWNRGGGNFFVVGTDAGSSGNLSDEIAKLLLMVESTVFPSVVNACHGIEQKTAFTFTVPVLPPTDGTLPQASPFPDMPKERLGFGGGVILLVFSLAMMVVAPAAFIFWIIGFFWAWSLLAPGIGNPAYNQEIERRKSAPENLLAELKSLAQTIKELGTQSSAEFRESKKFSSSRLTVLLNQEKLKFEGEREQVKRRFIVLREEANNIPKLRDFLSRKWAEKSQFEAHMRRVRIPSHGIHQIGPARFNTLISYGIFTAWDARQMGSIPGLGAGASELRIWLHRIEESFRFNSSLPLNSVGEQEVKKGVLAKEQEVLKQYQQDRNRWNACLQTADVQRVQQMIQDALAKEVGQLDKLNAKVRLDHANLNARWESLKLRYLQAVSDARSCPKVIKKWS